ncbi:phenylacetate-CoA oxygenase subunit PaaI [Halobacteriales archaeon QS_8_69_26]|nr:MAG: phenylacetate-CoA oxygenase subunit PaaI [Halobacteriales archaeon QS_8_69_26]
MATTDADLGSPGDLDEGEREAVEHLLYRLADDEFVLAERYTEWQVRAPTLESDLSLSNIAQDELGHARLWYDLLEDFGYSESDLVWERPPGEWRHATLSEVPFAEGDWADAVLRSYLYDVAEGIRLSALEESSYARIRDRVPKIRGEEGFHRDHAEGWLERLATDSGGLDRLQSALDRLFPHALALFAPTDPEIEDRIDDLGLRTASLSEMRGEWRSEVEPFLSELGLTVPDADRHTPHGRGGDHTGDWDDLHDDFTHTYRELGRTEARRIMVDPDEAES